MGKSWPGFALKLIKNTARITARLRVILSFAHWILGKGEPPEVFLQQEATTTVDGPDAAKLSLIHCKAGDWNPWVQKKKKKLLFEPQKPVADSFNKFDQKICSQQK